MQTSSLVRLRLLLWRLMEIDGQDEFENITILQHRPPTNFAHAVDG